jgi:hypothetical protein
MNSKVHKRSDPATLLSAMRNFEQIQQSRPFTSFIESQEFHWLQRLIGSAQLLTRLRSALCPPHPVFWLLLCASLPDTARCTSHLITTLRTLAPPFLSFNERLLPVLNNPEALRSRLQRLRESRIVPSTPDEVEWIEAALA